MQLGENVYAFDEGTGKIESYEIREFVAMGSDGTVYLKIDNGEEVYTEDAKTYISDDGTKKYYYNSFTAKQEAIKYLDETIDYLASQCDSLRFYTEARKKLKEAK